MEIDADKMLENAIRNAIQEGVKDRFKSGYNNPFDKILASAIERHMDALRGIIGESILSALNDAEFRQQVKAEVRTLLAKTMVKRFGGELEKQVNTLKSDPITRAKITLAIEAITKERDAGTE